MKVVIPGGSGQLGRLLARTLGAKGHEVVLISRALRSSLSENCRWMPWDGRTLGEWTREVDGADAVVNLAGRSVNCRYHKHNLAEMLGSRVDSTRVIGEAIAVARRPPNSWLQMSTATIYSHRFDAGNDELTGILGGLETGVPSYWRFSVDIGRAWEAAQATAETPATRKVILRSAMVMNPDRGSIFDTLVGLVRRRLGGSVAGGRQFVSWIHELDFVNAVLWLLEHQELQGPFNLAAPHPLPQSEFMAVLREACDVKLGLPATRWMAELGAVLMRTDAELLLKSRRVIPRRLPESGFRFTYPDWREAAGELVGRWGVETPARGKHPGVGHEREQTNAASRAL